MKTFFCLVSLLFVSVLAHADNKSPVWGDIVRNADGEVRGMEQKEAQRYCEKHGGRLPTAREFAELATSMWADGITETEFPGISIRDARLFKEMYFKVSGSRYAIYRFNDAEEITIDFYYDFGGYRRPEGDFGEHSFWTSDVVANVPGNFYAFWGGDGRLISDQPDAPESVRCVF